MESSFSDPKFLAKLKKKDSNAIRELVEKYNVVLYRAALAQLKNGEQSEEMVQSTWSAFFDAIDRFEGKSHIRTFLFGILYNKIKELFRHNKRFVNFEDPDPIIENMFDSSGFWKEAPETPEALLSGSESIDEVDECMNALVEKQRMAFYLKEVVGEATQDICNILDVSATNLGVLIYRAKNQLRVCLEAKNITGV
ncbi:MAG: RNA polymerase sigma factor [Bdellovibrionales bacterium]